MLIPEDDSVRLLSQILEGLDFTKLYQAYSIKGRKPAVDPKVMFKVLTYAYMNVTYTTHKIDQLFQGRNSYSKTDTDATFMHMKDDHMRNSQLKPAYNVQIAVESEYVTGVGIFQDRNDIATLIPMLEKMKENLGRKYTNVIADYGYESEENYLYLEKNEQIPFIKPQTYEVWKNKSFKKDIRKRENMTYDEKSDEYFCHSV
jgi:hypothetical protein